VYNTLFKTYIMRIFLITTFVGLSFINVLFGQDCNQLATITEGPATNASGLGFRFEGEVGNDGILYFRGSPNGISNSVWRSDGTEDGTFEILRAENQFRDNWDAFHFTPDGVFIQEDGAWGILRNGETTLSPLPQLGDISYDQLVQGPDGTYWFAGENNGMEEVINFDATTGMTINLGAVHTHQNFSDVYAGNLATLFFPDNGNNLDGLIYFKSETISFLITELLSVSGLQAQSISQASIVDDYLYVSFTNAQNQFSNVIININTTEVLDASNLIGDIFHVEVGNEIYFIADNGVLRLNTIDQSVIDIPIDIALFTPYLVLEDRLMVLGVNPNTGDTGLASIFLESGDVFYWPNAQTGNFFQNSKFLEHEGEFFYIANDNSNQTLFRYDFRQASPVRICDLSMITGATVVHALESVNGRLLPSKRFDNLQHEFFQCNVLFISTEDPTVINLNVYPSPTEDMLHLSSRELLNQFVRIFDVTGQLIATYNISLDQSINVSGLEAGMYIGEILQNNKKYLFKFVKI